MYKCDHQAATLLTEDLGAKQALLVRVLEKLNSAQAEYALVHPGDASLPDVDADVELIFGESPTKFIDQVIAEVSEDKNIQLVQKLYYDVWCGYYYIIAVRIPRGYTFLHLNCLYDPIGINRYHVSTSYLLEHRMQTAYGYRCNSERKAEFLLIKRIIKNSWTTTTMDDLQRVFDHEVTDRKGIIQKWLGSKGEELFDEFVRQHVMNEASASKLKQRLESRFAASHFFVWIIRHAMTAGQNLSRFLQPAGYFVAIVGPDGAGKSTINKLIQRHFSRGFRNIWHFHWRPKLLPKLRRTQAASLGNDSAAPPEESHYRGVVSLIRFLYYWMDFVLGYWLIIYPKRARSTLIIGERYFPDIIVHPERFGFSLPEWFIRLSAAFVPSADMIILLKDSPEAIFKRKPELSVNRIRSQISRYEKEILHWNVPKIIPTSSGEKEASDMIISLIVDACHKRYYL